MNLNIKKTLIIVGGGAAGCFCAAQIKHPNLEVLVLEKSNKLLSKVRISGGGRCNVTNAGYETIQAFAQQYPRGQHLLKKSLHHFSYKDTMQWFEQRGVPLKVEADGRVFPQSDDSESIIQCLLHTCEKNKVSFQLQTAVHKIEKQNNQYLVSTSQGNYLADFVCIATGGHPKKEAYQWFSDLDISIEEPVPSLFSFNLPQHPIQQLMGVAVPFVQIKIQGSKLQSEGALMITHWGLSGPAVLRLSAWAARDLAARQWHFDIQVNWLGEQFNEASLRQAFTNIRNAQGNKPLFHKNPFGIPARLWEYLLQEIEIPKEQKWATLTSKFQNKLIQQLCQYLFTVKGKTTYKEEFVTAGGVSLQALQANNFALKKEGWEAVYIIGETTDVDGITGGFNFQNAWTSGFIVAKDILREVNT